jgi:hypothetical protein
LTVLGIKITTEGAPTAVLEYNPEACALRVPLDLSILNVVAASGVAART